MRKKSERNYACEDPKARLELSFGLRDRSQVNSAHSLADFDSKWLLLVNSRTIVHLWKVDDKVGYLDRSRSGPNRWVWLSEETLSMMRPYTESQTYDAIRPDLELW